MTISLIVATIFMTCCSLCLGDKDPEIIIDPVETQGEMKLTRSELELVNHSNDFAFNLFRQITDRQRSSQDNKSIIVSPISITYALGMLNNGAANNTQSQINDVLGFGSFGADSINAFCKKMLYEAPNLDSLTKLMIANTIYVNKGYNLKADFVNKARFFYKAEPETRDFHDGQTMNVINKWASDHTERMIQKVLDEQSFDPSAVSYLLNAIYFKGIWSKKFDKSKTKNESFHNAGPSGELTQRPMMHQKAEFIYSETDDYQALGMPYGNGSYQMTVLLPKQKNGANINALPEIPDAERWQQINSNMRSVTVDVKLPRFETSTDIDLKEIMAKLGMPDAFDGGRADFSNFCDKPTYIGLMKQVAKIKLDEEGSEAAAVTVIGMKVTSAAPPAKEIVFHANHPFLYIISEKNSGAIFFMGQYTGY